MDGHQVAQDQRPGEPLVVHLIHVCVCDYRHAHGNALVAAAAVGHRRQGASGHAGVGRSGSHAHGVAHIVVAEHFALVFPDGAAHLHAVVPGEPFLRQGQVEAAVFEDEGNLFKWNGGGKVQDFAHGEAAVARRMVPSSRG